MKKLIKPLAIALLLAVASTGAMAAPAPAAGGTNGVGFVNLEAVMQNSAAFKTALAQRQVTYKPQIDAYNAKAAQFDAQLKPLAEKFQKDRAAGVAQTTLQQEYAAIQQIQESAKQELAQIMQPEQMSEAYGQEQITAKLQTVVPAAMQKAGVTLLLRQDAVVFGPAANLSTGVLAELDAQLPHVEIVPPAGWEPAEVRAQKAQQAAQSGRGTADTGR